MAEHGVRAAVCVPIVSPDGEAAYGVLQVDAREPRPFGEAEVAFLRTYANMLASAVSRLRTAAELRRRAEDNERLLRELQHRVKNNLQVMVGLVEVQARREHTPSAKAALRAVGRRVEALRLLHDKLHLAGEVTGWTSATTWASSRRGCCASTRARRRGSGWCWRLSAGSSHPWTQRRRSAS